MNQDQHIDDLQRQKGVGSQHRAGPRYQIIEASEQSEQEERYCECCGKALTTRAWADEDTPIEATPFCTNSRCPMVGKAQVGKIDFE